MFGTSWIDNPNMTIWLNHYQNTLLVYMKTDLEHGIVLWKSLLNMIFNIVNHMEKFSKIMI